MEIAAFKHFKSDKFFYQNKSKVNKRKKTMQRVYLYMLTSQFVNLWPCLSALFKNNTNAESASNKAESGRKD